MGLYNSPILLDIDGASYMYIHVRLTDVYVYTANYNFNVRNMPIIMIIYITMSTT